MHTPQLNNIDQNVASAQNDPFAPQLSPLQRILSVLQRPDVFIASANPNYSSASRQLVNDQFEKGRLDRLELAMSGTYTVFDEPPDAKLLLFIAGFVIPQATATALAISFFEHGTQGDIVGMLLDAALFAAPFVAEAAAGAIGRWVDGTVSGAETVGIGTSSNSLFSVLDDMPEQNPELFGLNIGKTDEEFKLFQDIIQKEGGELIYDHNSIDVLREITGQPTMRALTEIKDDKIVVTVGRPTRYIDIYHETTHVLEFQKAIENNIPWNDLPRILGSTGNDVVTRYMESEALRAELILAEQAGFREGYIKFIKKELDMIWGPEQFTVYQKDPQVRDIIDKMRIFPDFPN